MTHQYIGARYVPLFADPIQWDITTAYEPLTIVTNAGTSYTSRQKVPAGTAITDTNYWVETGNYNAQVAQYHQDVEDLRDTIGQAKKRLVMVGDSYADVTHAANIRWDQYLKDYLGLTAGDYYTTADSGAGFVTLSNNGYTFETLLNLLNVTNPETISHVVVVGGINDLSQPDADIRNAIDSFCNTVRSMFPNAKIIYSFCQRNYAASAFTMISKRDLFNTRMLYNKAFADNKGFARIWNRTLISGDGIHPTISGSDYIGKQLAYIVNGVESDFDQMFNNSPGFTSAIGTVGASSFYRAIYKNGIVYNFINIEITGASQAFNNNANIVIANVGSAVIDKLHEIGQWRTETEIYINGSLVKVLMYIQDDELHIINLSGSNITISTLSNFASSGNYHFERPAEFM